MKLRQDTPYVWEPNAARYRDTATGRFVAASQVEAWSSESITATQGVVTDLAASANDNPTGWYSSMRDEIKGEYLRQYLSAAGGRNNMTPSDWGSVGGMIADQYSYLQEFYTQVQTGDLSPEAIAARSRMYINSAREAFARASQRSHAVAGYTQKVWLLGVTEQHCEDCPALAAIGWVPIDFEYMASGGVAYPGNGATQCLTNCDCRLEFRR